MRAFTLACSNVAATTYTGTATGITGSGMESFTYTVDQADAKGTTSVDSGKGWSGAGATCWVTRKDGTCG